MHSLLLYVKSFVVIVVISYFIVVEKRNTVNFYVNLLFIPFHDFFLSLCFVGQYLQSSVSIVKYIYLVLKYRM